MGRTFAPLQGIKVIDFSHVIAGPFATFHLALMGADVLKIENPNGGDVMRRGERGHESFLALNAGKRLAVFDIAAPDDRTSVIDLVRGADVFVDNLRPGVLEKHGLGYAAMQAINPGLIYCSISGFGRSKGSPSSTGWQGRPAYDHIVQAASGMTLTGGLDGEPPVKVGFPVIDAGAGIIAAFAIVSALLERDRTGLGMLLDVSMAGAALHLMYPMTCEALTHGTSPKRVGTQAFSGSPAADLFPTLDCQWIALAANTPKQFLALLAVLGLSDLARDPALFDPPLDANAPASFLRTKDMAAVKRALAAEILRFDAADLETELAAVTVPAARVRTLGEFAQEAQTADAIDVIELAGDGARVVSPGLGFRVVRASKA